jgi:hypothetical protein
MLTTELRVWRGQRTLDSRHDRLFRCSIQAATRGALICIRCAAEYVIINDLAFCELCDMECEFCEHGLVERRTRVVAISRLLLISPNGMVYFSGCPHKGDDPDYRRWAELDMRRARNDWETANSWRRPVESVRT